MLEHLPPHSSLSSSRPSHYSLMQRQRPTYLLHVSPAPLWYPRRSSQISYVSFSLESHCIYKTLTQHSGEPIPIRQSSPVKLKSICNPCLIMILTFCFVFSCLQIVFTYMVLFGHQASEMRVIPSLHVRKLRLREIK